MGMHSYQAHKWLGLQEVMQHMIKPVLYVHTKTLLAMDTCFHKNIIQLYTCSSW